VRCASVAPQVVLSAMSAQGDKVAALDAGADEYLTEPFGAADLIACNQRTYDDKPTTAMPTGCSCDLAT